MRFHAHLATLPAALVLAAGSLSLAASAPAAHAATIAYSVTIEDPVEDPVRGDPVEDPVRGDPVEDPVRGDPAPTPTPTPTDPAPTARPPRSAPHGPGGSMAATGAHGERLWLLGGLALTLAAAGVVAKAAQRGRREP
ncbi:hypothetical protein [Streptomyces vilmorinianum]|uniref:hypothetical protein n=1 Tax=Streptomyces vilmorinianum TaxID=3051092 RepID=UPI0015868996|nr:hypothetical protein [Streptomyces vilmorinianum]